MNITLLVFAVVRAICAVNATNEKEAEHRSAAKLFRSGFRKLMIYLQNFAFSFGLDGNIERQTHGLLRTCASNRFWAARDRHKGVNLNDRGTFELVAVAKKSLQPKHHRLYKILQIMRLGVFTHSLSINCLGSQSIQPCTWGGNASFFSKKH